MTVEHILSAFAGLNIDNAFIEIDAEEIPIMDGSARPFVRLIADAGIQPQEKLQPMLKVIRPISCAKATSNSLSGPPRERAYPTLSTSTIPC